MNCPYDKKACDLGHSILICQNCPRFDKKKYNEMIAKREHIPDIPEDFRKYPLTPGECYKLDNAELKKVHKFKILGRTFYFCY